MEKELVQFLENFQVFTKEELDMIVAHTSIKTFPKGTVLLNEGEVAKDCYLVLKGCIREYYIIDGVEKTTAFFTEGQPVNAFTSSAHAQAAKHFLVCAEECVLTVSDQSLEQAMCERIPRLETIIRQEVEKFTGELQDRLALFMTSSPKQRFLKLMEDNPGLIGRVPQHQIASYLGITPESLSRIKKRLYTKDQSTNTI
ncbi:Crp/Fnr family transcriptional regulator [Rapidithrix thailandica]|uniref:Crp/Fnr family transcriptional regulator n=1 Tax=Rapidithrix thailandica TaxID=413964 RepID=A0AAW9SKH4_9BACT